MTDRETASVQGEDAREAVPAPSDEAVEAAARVTDPCAFTGEGYSPGAAAQSREHAMAKAEAMLTAAYAIDLPALLAKARAEGEAAAARTAEIVAWLREWKHPDLPVRWSADFADAIAERFPC